MFSTAGPRTFYSIRPMEYLFGDTDIAAHRLKILAEVYAESTRTFILDTVIDRPHLAVDLGCGPGFTTHLLADTTQCDRAVGLDNSDHFVSLAQKTASDTVSFRRHDVTSTPFPIGPSDLLYCRFLLTHLANPQAMVTQWASQLRPRGLLLMEETEWICTKNAAFVKYLGIVEAMIRDQGGNLYAGVLLDGIGTTDLLERRISQVRRFPVSTAQAALMFSLNIRSWKEQRFVRENYTPSVIGQLEHELGNLTERSDSAIEIEWGLRQIVFERI